MTQTTDDRALLIKKLLNKAEARGTTPEEAESLSAKAAQLMIKWGIEEAMIADADRTVVEQIIKKQFRHDAPKAYSYGYTVLGIRIAEAFGCRGLSMAMRDGRVDLIVVGFESDVERIGILLQSLALQCTMRLGSWYTANVREWHTPVNRSNMKKSFIMGFATGVEAKFRESRRAAVAESGTGAELVLVDRKRRVQSWVDDNMTLGTARARKVDASSRGAGYAAGKNANIGGSQLGGGRPAIGGR